MGGGKRGWFCIAVEVQCVLFSYSREGELKQPNYEPRQKRFLQPYSAAERLGDLFSRLSHTATRDTLRFCRSQVKGINLGEIEWSGWSSFSKTEFVGVFVASVLICNICKKCFCCAAPCWVVVLTWSSGWRGVSFSRFSGKDFPSLF